MSALLATRAYASGVPPCLQSACAAMQNRLDEFRYTKKSITGARAPARCTPSDRAWLSHARAGELGRRARPRRRGVHDRGSRGSRARFPGTRQLLSDCAAEIAIRGIEQRPAGLPYALPGEAPGPHRRTLGIHHRWRLEHGRVAGARISESGDDRDRLVHPRGPSARLGRKGHGRSGTAPWSRLDVRHCTALKRMQICLSRHGDCWSFAALSKVVPGHAAGPAVLNIPSMTRDRSE